MILPKRIFNSDDIKLKILYDGLDDSYNIIRLHSSKIKSIYGDYLKLQNNNRPTLLACFVSSIDGKIGFPDSANGTLIAKNNKYDINGGIADFWIMNMLRANSDAVVIGSGTLRDEPNVSAHIFDEELENDRLKAGLSKIPINIVVSKSGRTIPYNHSLLKSKVPIFIVTSLEGSQYIRSQLNSNYYEIVASSCNEVNTNKDSIKSLFNENIDKIGLVVCGNDNSINNHVFLDILSLLDIKVISVEASYYSHQLIKDKLLDEIFLNYSGIYVGGDANSIARGDIGFSSDGFPHCRMLSLHMHSPYFTYTRQKLIYD